MSFEESLVRHASPTLAGIKVANLYNFRFSSREECMATLARFNAIMNEKGIYIELMQNRGDFYLIYVYRRNQLLQLLESDDVRSFLSQYGYPVKDSTLRCLDACLAFMKMKLSMDDIFPHEIGVFLGYPLEDVIAFIEAKGQDCTVCGEWKAYHDQEGAECTFCRYRHCRDVYMKVYKRGKKFSEMLVSA